MPLSFTLCMFNRLITRWSLVQIRYRQQRRAVEREVIIWQLAEVQIMACIDEALKSLALNQLGIGIMQLTQSFF